MESNNNKQEIELDSSYELENLVELYSIMLGHGQYEGSGIWDRFNIMFSVNMVLFGVVAFIFSNQPDNWKIFIIIIGVLGVLLSLWSVYVLRRLWMWHYHWKAILRKIESGFPVHNAWPRPFSDVPQVLKKKHRWYLTWLLAYTQPFFIILATIWVLLTILIFLIAVRPP